MAILQFKNERIDRLIEEKCALLTTIKTRNKAVCLFRESTYESNKSDMRRVNQIESELRILTKTK